MRASQTVYLTQDRSRAVAEGDKDAQFLLVRQGGEISQEKAEQYSGAIELIGGTKKATRGTESREPATETRDPEPAAKAEPKPKRKRGH